MSQQQFKTLPRLTQSYVSIVVLAGLVIIAQSLYDLIVNPIGWDWTLLALLTLVSGSATIRLPSLPATISVSETFVVTSVLLFGASAGTLTVALDALVISLWSYTKGHHLYKIVFNVCALPLTIWLAAHALFLYPGITPLVHMTGAVDIQPLLLPLALFTILYFLLNSWIITFAISLEKGLPPLAIWKTNFLWLSLNYFGGASVAILLVSYTRELNYTYIAVIIPLLIVLYFTFSTSMGRVADANRHLAQLNSLYMSTIETLAMAIDAKDQITHGHIRRVQTLAVRLAKEAGVSDPSLIRAIEAASLLHDMGKLAVPEYILNKPGPLTAAEFEKMKLHASVGADILSAINFPDPVVPIVRHHHENWDGTGYPDRLSGTQIPVGARILSVVDCFDALTSDRPYRPRLSDRDALQILAERRGKMYDPLIVDTFVRVHEQIAVPMPAPDNLLLRTISRASVPVSDQFQNRRLEEIAASTDEMLTLFNLAKGIAVEMPLAGLGDMVAQHLRRLVPYSLCAFFLYDKETDQIVVRHAVGEHLELATSLRLKLGERLSGWVAANRQSIRNSDPVLDLGDTTRTLEPRLRSCLSTPLVAGDELVGVLTLYSSGKDTFTEEHQRISQVVSNQVAPIVKKTLDATHPHAVGHTEPLRNLPGLNHLRQFPVGQNNLPDVTSVVLMDVQWPAGEDGTTNSDGILSEIANVCRECLRPTDLIFRIDQHRLLCVLMATDRMLAAQISASLRRRIQAARETGLHYTIATGTATAPADGAGLTELIAASSQRLQGALTRGKSPGDDRNQSVH